MLLVNIRHPFTPLSCTKSDSGCVARTSIIPNGLLEAILKPLSATTATLPPAPASHDLAGQTLLETLASEHSMPLDNITASSIPGQGRGIVAARTIRAKEPAIVLPSSAVVTARTALASLGAFGEVLREAALPEWTCLAVWLAVLLNDSQELNGFAMREASLTQHAYRAVLPSCTGCILEWTDEEVRWLRGSYLHTLATSIRSSFDASWEELSPVLHQAATAGVIPESVSTSLTTNALRHAFALLLSRLVRLEGVDTGDGEGKTVEALCPGADLANHDCTSTSYLTWSEKENAVILRAYKTLKPGEQVTACYGTKTNGELLLSYGFVPAEGSNPHDACLLGINMLGGSSAATKHTNESRMEYKGDALRRRRKGMRFQGNTDTVVFPLRMGALPNGLIAHAAFAAVDVEDAESAEELAAATLDVGEGDESALSRELLVAGMELVICRCKGALKGYAVGMEAAKSELEALRQRGLGEERRALVLSVLLQEQRVLNRTVFLLQGRVKELKKGGRSV